MKKSKPLKAIASLLLFALLGYFGVMFFKQEKVLSEQRAKIEQIKSENEKLDREYKEMLDRISEKGTPEYIERYMRERFGMIKDNEIIIDLE